MTLALRTVICWAASILPVSILISVSRAMKRVFTISAVCSRRSIASKNTALATTVENTIYLPHSGDVFSEVESVAVADGIICFNTNRIRIDNSITCAVSVLTDPETQTDILEQRAAFVQDGLYMLRGSSSTDYLVVDPAAEDTHLTVQKTSPGTATYFGFESNE